MTRKPKPFRYGHSTHELETLMQLRDKAVAAQAAHLRAVPVRSTVISGQRLDALGPEPTERQSA